MLEPPSRSRTQAAEGGRAIRPTAAAARATARFVGREREIDLGLTALDDVLDGHGRVLLIGGEPGIGKSRLADELAGRARQLGFHVAWGRCWEAGGAPAYWPWVQSLRSIASRLEAPLVRSMLGPRAPAIAQLLPDVDLDGPAASDAQEDPDNARFRLFDATASFLRAAAAREPLLLVLDDLHAADAPSVLLLGFVAAAVADERVLVVGTYRDTDVIHGGAIASALADLTRAPSVQRLLLLGLSADGVRHFMQSAAGVTPADDLARMVHSETGGNPLFVEEVTRLLVEEGRLDRDGPPRLARIEMPRTVRDVIGRRLRHLSPESLRLLSLASVLGREFRVDALAQLAELPAEEVVRALDAPFEARVLTDVPGSRSQLRFAHMVFRECLYDDIGVAARIDVHRRAARVLEAMYADDVDSHLSEIAHHYFEGAARGDVDKAVEYARRAADKANSVLAYEEAVRMYRIALDGMSLSTVDPVERCEVLLRLGEAQARAGEQGESRESFLQAAAIARTLGPGEMLARAALGYGGRLVWVRAGADTRLIPLLLDGLAAVADGNLGLRVRLLARLAGALRDDPSPEPRESTARQAVELARSGGDPATLAYALDGLHAALWKPDNPAERLEIVAEMVAAAEAAGDLERIVAGHRYELCAHLEMADAEGVRRALSSMELAASQLRHAADTWWAAVCRAHIALIDDRLDDAERLIEAALPLGLRAVRSDAAAVHRLMLFQIRRQQGRLAEMVDVIRESAKEYSWYPMFRCARALLQCELGEHANARSELDDLGAGGFVRIPFDNEWLFSLAMLSEVAHALGDARHAAELYRALLPYADRIALGALEGCIGPVSRFLGLLAATMSHPQVAARHFEDAIATAQRMRAPGWAAQARADLMTKVELAAVEGAPATEQAAAQSAVGEGSLQREGEYWSIAYGTGVIRLRDSKGLRVLAELLTSPGRPHPALELERLGEESGEATAHAVAVQSAGELIDVSAKREYRARLQEIDDEIEAAEGLSKADVAGALREEKAFIVAELSRALGLGGRARVAGSTAERARLNVTRAVRSTIRRIGAADAELAAHLDAAVRTGTVCVYHPDPRSPMQWRVRSAAGT